MSESTAKTVTSDDVDQNAELILNHINDAILTVDIDNQITYVNAVGEEILGTSAPILKRQKIDDVLPFDSPLIALITQTRLKKNRITEYDVNISNVKMGNLSADVHVSPIFDDDNEDMILIQLQQRSMIDKIHKQNSHLNAARSVSGMTAMLAHEIKNPLSGIKGSAQLLAQELSDDDISLTNLICEEVDRISGLIDRMEIFTDPLDFDDETINIHSVLEHIKKLAENGFGKHVQFIETYDPSLPQTRGSRNALIQVFLNIIKNACEALPPVNGMIKLTTAYRQGMKIMASGTDEPLNVPLEICVIDNGAGISDSVKEDIFEPFVTTKSNGTGLGLALVAKIVRDHGGIVECETEKDKTIFRILLPSANF